MTVTINGVKLNDAQAFALHVATVRAQSTIDQSHFTPEQKDAFSDRFAELLRLMERPEHAATD